MRFRVDARYHPFSNVQHLSDKEMDRRMTPFRAALGPDDRAHANPTELALTVKLDVDSDIQAKMKATELVQDALDAADLYGYLQTREFNASEFP
jgi:hypothetical protein